MSSCKQDVSSWNPKQFELKFFFPLTEQIPLELDFTPCNVHEYYIRAKGIAGAHGPFATGMVYKFADTTNIQPTVQFNIDNTTFNIVSKHKPNIIRRYLYKALGINWKTT